MQLMVNGESIVTEAKDLASLLDTLGYAGAKVATALNGDIVHRDDRGAVSIKAGDAVEIVAPMQGG